MFNYRHLPILAITLTAFPALAAPGADPAFAQAELDQEIRSCVAEVGLRANYDDAIQVRHEIVVTKRRSIGHKLDIRTSVYSDAGDEAIRAYATRCIVYRDNKPVRFRISELDTGA